MSFDPYGLRSSQHTDSFLSMFDKKAESSTSYTHDIATLSMPKVELYPSVPTSKLSYKTEDIFATKPGGYTSSHWASLPSSPVKVSNHTDYDLYKSSTPNSNVGSAHYDHKSINDILANINTSGMDNFSKYLSVNNLTDDKKIGSISSLGNVDSKTDLLSVPVSRTLQSEHKYEIKDPISVFDFLSKVKATDHTKMNELFLLASQYSQARIFSGSQQGIYLTLSFSFYEKLLLNDPTSEKIDFSPVLNKVFDKNTEKIVNKLSYKNFIVDLKRFLVEKDATQGIGLYNSICNYSETYEASLIFFREVLIENLKSYSTQARNSLQEFDGSAFKWIHDLFLSSTTFYQEVADILKTNLKVFMLTATDFEQRTFIYSDLYSIPRSSEVVIFLDKRDGVCYILYLSKDQVKAASPAIDVTSTLTSSPSKKQNHYKRGSSTPVGYSSGSKAFDFSTENKVSLSKESIDALLYPKTTTAAVTSTETYGTKSTDIYGLKSSMTLLDTVMNTKPLTAKPADTAKITEPLKLSHDPYGIAHLLPKAEEKSSLDVQALLAKYDASPAASPTIAKSLGLGSFGEGISPLAKHDTLFAADQVLSGKTGTFTEAYKEKSINSLVDQLLNDKSMASIAELLKDKTSKPTSNEKIETSIMDRGIADLLAKDKKQELTVAQLLGDYPAASTKHVDFTVDQLLNQKPVAASADDKDIKLKVEQLLKEVEVKSAVDAFLGGNNANAITTSITGVDPLIGFTSTYDRPASLTVEALLRDLNGTPKADQTSSPVGGHQYSAGISPVFDRIYNEASTTLFSGFNIEKVPMTDFQIQNPLVNQLLNNERTSTPVASVTPGNSTPMASLTPNNGTPIARFGTGNLGTEAFDLLFKEKVSSAGLRPNEINHTVDLLLGKITSGGSGSAGQRSHKGSDHLVDLILGEKSVTPVSDHSNIEKNTNQIIDILAVEKTAELNNNVNGVNYDLLNAKLVNPLVEQILNNQEISKLDLSPMSNFSNSIAEQIIREFTPKSDYMKTTLQIRTLPNALKQQFKNSAKEVEGHEHEFNKISQRFLEESKEKKELPPAIVSVVNKYKAIMNSKKK